MDDVKGTLFSFLAVLQMSVRLFRIKQVRASKKGLAGAI